MSGEYAEEWDECFYCMSENDFKAYSPILIHAKMGKELQAIEASRLAFRRES